MAKASKPSAAKAAVRYTAALGAEICNRLADGESLNSICKTEGMPSETAVRLWAADSEHPFSSKYARARQIGYIRMADELLAISDGAKAEQESGNVDNAKVQRDRLRVDTRKWLLARCLPKVFGDKIVAEHTGPDGSPIRAEISLEESPTDFARRMALLLSGRGPILK